MTLKNDVPSIQEILVVSSDLDSCPIKKKEWENQKKYKLKYRERPETKEKIRKYNQEYFKRPEIKKRQREYQHEYYQHPEVKERRRKQQQKYRLHKKQIKSEKGD